MHPTLRRSLLLPLLLSLLPTLLPVSPPDPRSPTAPPADLDIATLMSKNGCKTFADLLRSTGDAADSFASNVASGLTAFCPTDLAVKPFLPRFKNLTADGQISILLYHAIPIYYSIRMLESNNGVVNTLATDGTNKNYNFTVQNDGDVVTLRTRVTAARVTRTILDEDPVAVYAIDAVLEPAELFKPSPAPAPAPAPAKEVEADSPESAGKRKKKHGSGKVGSPAESTADQKVADDSGAGGGRRVLAGVAGGGAAAGLFFVMVFV